MTDRLCDMVVATSRHAGQHALDDEGVEQVDGAECLPGVEADLLTSRRPGPWPVDFHEAAAEHDRARRGAVPVPGAFAGGEFGMLGPDRLGELGLHHLGHDDEPGRRGEREGSVFDRVGDLGERHGCLERQLSDPSCFAHLSDCHDRYRLLHGGPLPVGCSWWNARHLPDGRSQAGDHPFTSTTSGTRSAAAAGICTFVAALWMASHRARAAVRLHLARLLLVALRGCAGDSAWSG